MLVNSQAALIESVRINDQLFRNEIFLEQNKKSLGFCKLKAWYSYKGILTTNLKIRHALSVLENNARSFAGYADVQSECWFQDMLFLLPHGAPWHQHVSGLTDRPRGILNTKKYGPQDFHGKYPTAGTLHI